MLEVDVLELLTLLDHHPLPVIAATNFARHHDPATARRIVFKLQLKSLSGDLKERAFVRFFAMPAPASLGDLRDLTPGNFALVARQMRHFPVATGQEMVERLASKERPKPGAMQRIGF